MRAARLRNLVAGLQCCAVQPNLSNDIREASMAVIVEKNGPVTTIINSRPEVRNAVNPEQALALVETFEHIAV